MRGETEIVCVCVSLFNNIEDCILAKLSPLPLIMDAEFQREISTHPHQHTCMFLDYVCTYTKYDKYQFKLKTM